MYSDPPNNKFLSAPGHHHSKTRTLHLSEKPSEGILYMSQEIEKIERDSLNRRNLFMTEENQRLKSQLNAFEQEYEKLLKEKAEELESFQLEKLDYEMNLRVLKEKSDEIMMEINEKKEENMRFSGEIEILLEKIDVLVRTQEKLKASNNSLSMKLERVQSNSMSINKEFENVSLFSNVLLITCI